MNIYEFLLSRSGMNDKRRTLADANITPEYISANRKTDRLCAEAFSWFERFYARCAKNAVLDYSRHRRSIHRRRNNIKQQRPIRTGILRGIHKNLRLKEILVKAPILGNNKL